MHRFYSLLTRPRITLFLLLMSLVLVVYLVLLFSLPAALHDERVGGRVDFSADHANIFRFGDCVHVHWSAEGIGEIYINSLPTVGNDQRDLCINGDSQSLPTLRVLFSDDSERIYRLEIGVLSRQWLFWIAAFACPLLLVASAWLMWGAAFVRRIGRLTHLFCWTWRIAQGAALLLVVTALLLEWALPAFIRQFGTPEEQKRYLYSDQEIAAQTVQSRTLPYVGYGGWPDYPEHNSLGYRSPEVAIPKPDGVFRIVAIGHSATYGLFLAPENTYPAQLQTILREKGYSKLEVVNTGLPGYSSWDMLANYIFRSVELKPDLLIFTDVTNDVMPRTVTPECYAGMNPLRGLNPMRSIAQQFRSNTQSTLYRFLAINMGWMIDPTSIIPPISYLGVVCTSGNQENDANLVLNTPIYFRRNLRELVAVARGNGTAIMFSNSANNPFVAENDPVWTLARRAAVNELNDVMAEVADELNVPFYNLTQSGIAEVRENWSDRLHLSATGTRLQAEYYADFLLTHGLLPPK